jgi:hypothetical protein
LLFLAEPKMPDINDNAANSPILFFIPDIINIF